ncbi:hypothetical protein C8F04DRAFT_1395310 [Mycena alexandri]|uniref:C2H2-type domain-containing protein n=1 Tax=Mycena alexandri TaxID=1745969 RepID=A0AAD6SYS3_9AGAR|nr:hypothetical protein C8F04DRAFT_1395310 [Mycena alexandri]
MQATVVERSIFGDSSNEMSVESPKSQNIIDAEAELYNLFIKFHTSLGAPHEFDTSVINDYVPSEPETFASAALRRHDRQHGVRHYRLPSSSSFTFPKYPTLNENEPNMPMGLVPVPTRQSFESKVFGLEKDEAPPVIRFPLTPNLWALPIVDAPVGIRPQSLLIRPTAAAVSVSVATHPAGGNSAQSPPTPTLSPSRLTIKLPSRAQNGAPPPPLSFTPSQPSPDYCAPQDNVKKRKALNPPAPRNPKKSTVVPRALLPAPDPPRKPALRCGIDGCSETFDDQTNLHRHQQRHLRSRQRSSCAGCPAVYGTAEELQTHLAQSPECTSENAARLLQAFYLQPEIIAINPATATQNELMGYWTQFVQMVTLHISQKYRN